MKSPSKIADYTERKEYQRNYSKKNREAINARKREWRKRRKYATKDSEMNYHPKASLDTNPGEGAAKQPGKAPSTLCEVGIVSQDATTATADRTSDRSTPPVPEGSNDSTDERQPK